MEKRHYLFFEPHEEIDALVEMYKSNERDHALHVLNLERYTTMLQGLPEGTFRQRIEMLSRQTAERLVEVDAILDATRPQLPQSPDVLNEAKLRLQARQPMAQPK